MDALAAKLGKALPMKRPAAAATCGTAKAKATGGTAKAKAKAKQTASKANQTAPKAKQTAPRAKAKKKFPFMLGCGKCRGAVNGCAKCRNPNFGGKRFRGTGKK